MLGALAALTLNSCLQHETTVTLKKDGSGTIIEETRLGKQMLDMLAQFAAMGGEEGEKKDPLAEMFDEEKMRKRAANLGEGVEFVKAEPSEANGSKGAKVTYRFKDINTIKVSAGDGMEHTNPMADAMPAEAKEEIKKAEPIRFNYKDGTLSIRMPKPEKPAANEAAAAKPGEMPGMDGPEAEAMMKQMFGDMRMSLKLVIEPGIKESNASHQDGNTITLMDMEMGRLMGNMENFKKLAETGQKDPDAAMELLKGIDGVKVETKEEISVKLD